MPNYDYANGTGLTALVKRTFEKIKSKITTDVVTSEAANPIVIETDAAQYAKKTHLTLEPVQDLHGYDRPWPAGGGKNLLDYGNVHSSNIGVTATYNLYTGEYKVNFATGGQHQAVLSIANASSLAGKTVTFSYDSVSVSNSSRLSDWRIFLLTYVNGTNETIIANINSGTEKTVTVSLDSSITEIRVLFRMSQRHTSEVQSGDYVIWNKAQLELGSTATAYEPYSNICPITPMGHRNLLPMTVEEIKAANSGGGGTWSGNAYTRDGVTFTVLTDGADNVIGIRATGTASSNLVVIYLPLTTELNGNYVLTGCPSGGAAGEQSTYNLRIGRTSSSTFVGNEIGNGFAFTASGDVYRVDVQIAPAAGNADLLFQPMLRPASDPDSTFVPYGMARVGAKVTGKNLIDPSTFIAIYGGPDSIDSDGYISDSTPSSDSRGWAYNSSNFKLTLKAGTYTLLWENAIASSEASYGLRLYTEDNTAIVAINNSSEEGSIGVHSVEFSLSEDCAVGLMAKIYDAKVRYAIYLKSDSSTEYEPYTESVSSLDLPEPVYSGTLDLETGEVVVDMEMVDLGTLTWTMRINNRKEARLPVIGKSHGEKETPNVLCSIYKKDTYYNIATVGVDKTVGTYTDGAWIEICDSAYSDATAFTNAMSGAQFVYELATPVTYQLTPQQLVLFKGINSISTNAKTVQVTYRNGELATTGNIVDAVEVAKKNAIGESASYTDARLATELAPILGNFATAETSPASAPHAVGEYLLYNKRLFKVLAAISAGQQLTIGTNIEQTSVAAELASLNNVAIHFITDVNEGSGTQSNLIDVITNVMTVNGFYQITGTYTNHAYGYTATGWRVSYANEPRYAGVVICHDGNVMAFSKQGTSTAVIKVLATP